MGLRPRTAWTGGSLLLQTTKHHNLDPAVLLTTFLSLVAGDGLVGTDAHSHDLARIDAGSQQYVAYRFLDSGM